MEAVVEKVYNMRGVNVLVFDREMPRSAWDLIVVDDVEYKVGHVYDFNAPAVTVESNNDFLGKTVYFK